MTEAREFVGGCLCGRLRYRARDPIDAGYCHCRMCQRSSGAPVLAWGAFPTAGFAYEEGEPSTYESSARGHREFCPGCGAQIAFRDPGEPDRLDLNLATLDDPTSLEPQYHTWVKSRIPWFHIGDDLPRYEEEEPRS